MLWCHVQRVTGQVYTWSAQPKLKSGREMQPPHPQRQESTHLLMENVKELGHISSPATKLTGSQEGAHTIHSQEAQTFPGICPPHSSQEVFSGRVGCEKVEVSLQAAFLMKSKHQWVSSQSSSSVLAGKHRNLTEASLRHSYFLYPLA